MKPQKQLRSLLFKKRERKLRQDMGRPMIIPNKKKLANKYK